jgi:hypothetical protein
MPVTSGILKHVTIKRNICDSHGKYLMKMAFIFIVVDPQMGFVRFVNHNYFYGQNFQQEISKLVVKQDK